MLNFDEFKEYCLEHLRNALPEEYANSKISVNEVLKNNGRKLTGLTVLPEGENVAPNIYLEGFYMEYERGSDLDDIIEEMADICVGSMKPPMDIRDIGEKFKDLDYVKDRIIMVAVGRERNADLLRDCPHTNKEDLALIYKVMVGTDKDAVGTIVIHNEHLKFWNMDVEEIHDLAMKNTRELLPVTVQSMNEVMREIFSKDGMDPDMMDALFEEMPADMQMYVISNQSKVNGAASMFYEDVLSDLAERIGSDLYILPSSVHECIAVSTKVNTPEALADMVSEINDGQVAEDERLSDHVYHFDAETKKLSLADTTVEALGLVAESSTYEVAQTNTEGSRPRHAR